MPYRHLFTGFLLILLLPGCFSNNRHQGEKLYAQHCSGCHGDQGQGLARLIPPLAGSDYLVKHRAELPCLLRNGQNEPIVVNGVTYHNVMPGNKTMSTAQLTNLLNYVENHWGNKAAPRTILEVQTKLDSCRVP
ncbi:c-type cytochrome [Hymenobacter terrenus]|uniref:c-type cytochrome n=1 Tax=Hymenobacter terrenus TaxID=1629124 RepID=UPI000619F002|nr:cytochrome c [Hymenobacter terrenus]